MNVRKTLPFLLFMCCFFQAAWGQYVPILTQSYLVDERRDAFLQAQSPNRHNAFRVFKLDKSLHDAWRTFDQTASNRRRYKSWFMRKLRNEALVEYTNDGVFIGFDPLTHQQWSRSSDNPDELLYLNMRGAQVYGSIGKRVSFRSSLLENQVTLPNYITATVGNRGSLPGQGRTKATDGAFDFAVASGSVFIEAREGTSIAFGNDKHFYGNGYRSMLSSDNAFNQLYLSCSQQLFKGKIRYDVRWSQLFDNQRISSNSENEAAIVRKGATFHVLSAKPVQWLEIGVVEGGVWQRYDARSGSLPFDYNMVNPVIFSNSIVKDNDNQVTMFQGLNLNIQPDVSFSIYGQFMRIAYDDDAFASQLGVVKHNLFLEGLTLQAEFNQCQKNVVTQTDFDQVDLTHQGQPLMHAWGEDFSELMLRLNYRWRDAWVDLKYHQGDRELSAASYAQSIVDCKIGYLFNPHANFSVYSGYLSRKVEGVDEVSWVTFGFVTSIENLYYDF